MTEIDRSRGVKLIDSRNEFTKYGGYMKKVISLFILLTLAFSTTLSFGDLSQPSKWATNGIAYMIKEGCVPTHLQGDYSKPITRLEFTQLMIQTIEGITPDKDRKSVV